MTDNTLAVPGATLHYDVRGTGPALLISQSGEGDADRTVDLVDALAGDFTVVTYDRRGLSRSVLDDPAAVPTMVEHADDVHRLLAAVTTGPAAMLGCSFGAAIGLHLAVRHPESVHTLVAHEPVSPWLLPAGERAEHVQELLDVQRIHVEEGLTAALPVIAKVLGITPGNAEPDLTPHPFTPRRLANFDFFIGRDFTTIVRDDADPAALRNTPIRIIPAIGATTPPSVFDYRCAHELAALTGTEVAVFPGGHNGNLSHPRAYAARLAEILLVR